ncbi:alpha/beta fold hydrolase [Halomonas sp. ML-15]|uniref:alpha/beta fold hydrolase n=1 Tax=Halomonas sp. ML-15 TaxID=2773305 RepID=UPI0017473DE1|nr:alpha/beta fold hydrolase [Halomonas sp. ML-15]MBD3897131.1 alpha/beta fold hydrolase [Halomonas sp. ML-15]
MAEPVSLTLADGRLAGLSWGESNAPAWLALHGWLDNAATFSRLAPRLVEALGVRIVAIDFAGHGQSQPHPGGVDYAIWDYLHDALDALDELELAPATLLAHSMGAGVSCLLAGAFPERVERLMLIDSLGTLSTPAEQMPEQLRKGIQGHRRRLSAPPRYADIESAVAARGKGGVMPLDADTVRPLVTRNAAPLADGGVQLRTDPRLMRPSLVRFTPEQVLANLAAIQAPVMLVEGETGVLPKREGIERARAAVAQLHRRVLPGGHHLHLDPRTVSAVAEEIIAWYQQQGATR